MKKFYTCEHCGNMTSLIISSGAPLVCCGSKMTELLPNSVEASAEKHLPSVTVAGDTIEVTVGSVVHPMEEKHHIVFVYVETEKGGQLGRLSVGNDPKVSFRFADDKPVAVYAYCNIHGLWKTEL